MYKHAVENCDVNDKNNLKRYREHRERWVQWCDHDENSLSSQFSGMFWFDAVFRLVNETRNTSDQTFAAFNGLLAEALDSGFVAGQAIAIRKLVDKGPDVISLRRLARDIGANRECITREAYVAFDGLPYDCAAAEQRLHDDIANRLHAGEVGPFWVDRSATLSQFAHKTFDELSGVNECDRSREDLVAADIFVKLTLEIDNCGTEKITGAANKFLLHAADEASRKAIATTELTVVLSELSEMHKKLSKIGNYLSAKLVGEGPCALGAATAQFDVADRLDRPFVDSSRLKDLREWWSGYADASKRLGYETLTL